MRIARLERRAGSTSRTAAGKYYGDIVGLYHDYFDGATFLQYDFDRDGDMVFRCSEKEFIANFQKAFNTRARTAEEMTAVVQDITGDPLHYANPNYMGRPRMGNLSELDVYGD